jgi:hypothetical protein
MSDRKKTPDHSKAIPVPSTLTPAAPKGQPRHPHSDECVLVEDTQPGRAWTIVGTDVPVKPSRR